MVHGSCTDLGHIRTVMDCCNRRVDNKLLNPPGLTQQLLTHPLNAPLEMWRWFGHEYYASLSCRKPGSFRKSLYIFSSHVAYKLRFKLNVRWCNLDRSFKSHLIQTRVFVFCLLLYYFIKFLLLMYMFLLLWKFMMMYSVFLYFICRCTYNNSIIDCKLILNPCITSCTEISFYLFLYCFSSLLPSLK